jgi:trk system potassium uptake protein TrkA
MRTVFIGASALAITTAHLLLGRGHEVVIIEQDKGVIDALSEELDCGFVHADGSKPGVLREVDPAHTDFLFCLTGNDQANIIAGLVGRSLGFKRVVTKIDGPEFEHICLELGLVDIIIPARTIGRHLAEMVEGTDPLEISAKIKGDARVFSFIARAEDEQPFGDLKLPDDARVMCVYRDNAFLLPLPGDRLRTGDEVVLITHVRHLPALDERWGRRTANDQK